MSIATLNATGSGFRQIMCDFVSHNICDWAKRFRIPAYWYPLQVGYDKEIVRRIAQTRRYESTASGLRAMVALVVLRNKAIKPLLAAAQRRRKSRGAQNPRPIDKHYETIRTAMQGVFDELGLAA